MWWPFTINFINSQLMIAQCHTMSKALFVQNWDFLLWEFHNVVKLSKQATCTRYMTWCQFLIHTTFSLYCYTLSGLYHWTMWSTKMWSWIKLRWTLTLLHAAFILCCMNLFAILNQCTCVGYTHIHWIHMPHDIVYKPCSGGLHITRMLRDYLNWESN